MVITPGAVGFHHVAVRNALGRDGRVAGLEIVGAPADLQPQRAVEHDKNLVLMVVQMERGRVAMGHVCLDHRTGRRCLPCRDRNLMALRETTAFRRHPDL
jgi:hypothetical protein